MNHWFRYSGRWTSENINDVKNSKKKFLLAKCKCDTEGIDRDAGFFLMFLLHWLDGFHCIISELVDWFRGS